MLGKLGKRIWESSKSTHGYWLTRISLATQVIPLIGDNGLLPADNYLARVESAYGSKSEAFFQLPSVFWLYISDNALLILSWLGVILSFIVLIGYANSVLMFFLWALYMSFVHIGQLWYSYGWEMYK